MTSSGVFQFGGSDKSNDGEEEKTDVFKEFKGLLPNLTIGYDEVPLDADFAWLLFLLLLSTIWLTYSLYYNSRVFGYILTKFVNNFIIARYLYPDTKRCEQPYFRVSSFSLTFISGKIMFRDLVWITPDYSLRIQDGWIILRWWIPFEPQDIRKSDFSHSDARLSMLFNGFELHIYNRSQMYTLLERLFGINPPKFNQDYDKGGGGGLGGVGNKSPPDPGGNQSSSASSSTTTTTTAQQKKATDNDKLISFYLWRNFFPLTKIEILTGRFVFGNHTIPSTLLITFEEGHITYTSRPAVSPHDLFTHIAKAKAESFKIILAPSPKYIGIVEEPPRFMGEGFVVFQTNAIDLYYYQDEPGLAASVPEPIELVSGDVIHDFTAPAWGLDIKCGKGTHFGYGPWADRNRDHLYNFFYPPDYQVIIPTPKPKPGEMRTAENFYIRLSTLADAAIDILFITKEKETKALHVNAGPGSYLEISIPWICKEEGYQSHIWGQILHLDATTNLNFRSLAESETLEFDFKIVYPRIWNHHQTWICSLTGCKATVDLIFAHKIFFCDLIDDWAGKDRPDIVHFIPYTWKFSVKMIDFELITLANEFNWIDCSSKLNSENAQLAIVGDIYDMSFDLPFDEFLPPNVSIKIWIQGESLSAALYLPECNPHRETLHMLDKYAKLCPPLFNSSNQEPYFTAIRTSDLFSCDKKWSRSVSRTNGWIDCWSVRIVALSITYTYHPVPPKTHSPKPSEITTPEREELLLEPIRPESNSSSAKAAKSIPPDFNPGSMDPDLVELELEVGPSKICLYGTLFRMLWNIKENYIGEYQTFTDFNSNPSVTEPYELNKPPSKPSSIYGEANRPFDARLYRPLAVNVSVTLHNIQGHIMKSCDVNDSKSNIPPCPYLYLERLSFEMDKQYSETKMQLLLSPLILDAPEYTMALGNRTLSNTGHLILDSLQFRGHAMFSGLDRPLDSETLEYAWLIEVHLGEISGRLSLPQFQQIFTGLETLLLQVIQEDCSLQPPTPYQKCLHDMVQSLCPKTQTSGDNKMCPYSEDLKYRMVRIDLDSIALYFTDVNTVLSLELDQIKFCTCNLHSCHTSSGMTALFKEITLHHYISMSSSLSNFKSSKLYLAPTTNQSSQQLLQQQHSTTDSNDATFYEVCKINFGPIFVDSAELLSVVDNFTVNQDTFLRTHDEATKRLWFLWPQSKTTTSKEPTTTTTTTTNDTNGNNKNGKCGCVGGCVFFGNNSRGHDFFSLSKHDPTLNSEGNILWGESLLRPGEPVVGFQINTVFLLEEENEDTCELAPLFDRTNYCVTSPLSPSVRSNSVVAGNDSSLQNISSFLSTSQTNKSSRMGIFSRQLSSPCRSSPFPYRGNRSICNLNTSLSVSSAVNDEQRKLPLPDRPRNRSLSETDDIEVAKNLFKQNDDSNTLIDDIDDKKIVDFTSSHSRENSSKSGASKATETYFTLTDPYFSASDSFSSSSKESKSTTADRTLVTAPTHQPVETVKSDDTLVSIMSIPGSGPTCSGGVTFREQSMSQSALNKSRTSLQSTYSAPPDPGLTVTINGATTATINLDGDGILDGGESESDNHSISSSSFISAVSSQEEIGINALVDLRNQMEKAIIESPLLMSSYTNHLTRFKCSNHRHSNSSYDILTLRGRKKVIPRFVRATSNGLSCIRLAEKTNPGEGCSSYKGATVNGSSGLGGDDGDKQGDSEESKRNNEMNRFVFTPGSVYEKINIDWKNQNAKKRKSGIGADEVENDEDDEDYLENLAFKKRMEKQFSKTVEYRSEKLTILVRMNGEASVRISPLSLDGLKTFVDGITDSLAQVHPLTVLNHLNVKCFTSVSRKNQLKKEKTLEYGQLKHKAWKSTLDRENHNLNSSVQQQATTSGGGATSGRTRFGDAFQDVKSQFKTAPVESTVTANQYEENKRSKFQVFVQISKINIIVLQASLVEEFITFSALDDIRDLTCVSMFSVSMSKTNFDFYSSRQERRSLHTIISNNIRTQPTSAFAQFAQSDIVSRLLFRKPKKEQAEVEPVTIETHELLEEETVGSSGIGSLHVQLTRLKNSSSILKEAILTVIPSNQSRVNFYYDKIPDIGQHPTVLKTVPSSSSGTSTGATGQRRRSSGTTGRVFLRRQDGLDDFIKITDTSGGGGGGESANISMDAKVSGDGGSSGGESDNQLYSGFIMFEGGLEHIDLKAVKKREMQDEISNVNNSNTDQENVNKDTSANVNTSSESQVHHSTENIKEEVNNSASTAASGGGGGGTSGGTSAGENKKDRKYKRERDKGASSFIGEIGVIWLNFAAPLKTPNTRKIDYTRLDWHLLSTATPSINAWLSVGDRFVVAVKKMNSLYEQRVSSVITYLMISGLEIEGIHIPPQSKCYIRKYTPYSKSLQEDPSCQLMNVLRRYLNRHASLLEVEDNLKSDLLPPLQVLKRGVIAASRQWKNALYMPLLVEQNIRLTRGERDASSVYQSSIPLRLLFGAAVAPQKPVQDVTCSMNPDPMPSDERLTEIIDEQTKLLSAPSKPLDKEPNEVITTKGVVSTATPVRVEETLREQRTVGMPALRRGRTSSQPEIVITNGTRNGQTEENGVQVTRRKMSTLPNIFSRSSRGSVAFPLLTYPLESLGSGVNKAYGFLFSPNSHQSSCVKGNKRQESQCSLKSSSSSSSAPDAAIMSESLFNPKSGDNSDYHEENLYLWMSRQQDYMEAKHLYQTSGANNNNSNTNNQSNHRRTSSLNPRNVELDPTRYATLGSAYSYEDESAAAAVAVDAAGNATDPVVEVPPGFVFVPTGVQLNNVRIIFQPLFSSLGVENFTEEGEAAISFDQLGPKITLSASIKMFKVNIVESEVADANRSRSSPISFNSSTTDRPATMKSTTSATSHLRPDFLFSTSTHPPSSQSTSQSQSQHHQSSSSLKLETSAFVCDGLVVGLDLRKVKDTMSSTGEQNVNIDPSTVPHHSSSTAPHTASGGGGGGGGITLEEKSNDRENENVPIVIVGPDGGINEITTTINFSVDVHQIIQRVNLPLLRLLHQVASMCESIKETREELKANRIEGTSSPGVKASDFIISNGAGVSSVVGDDGVEIEEINVGDTSRSPSLTSLRPLTSRSMIQRNSKSREESVNINIVKETIIEMPANDDDSVEIALVGSAVDGLPSPGDVDEPEPIANQLKCWRTMYYLLDLYETTPETKTIIERAERPPTTMQQIETKITIEEEDTNRTRGKGGYEQLKDNFSDADDLSTPTTGGRKVSLAEVNVGIGTGAGSGAQRKSMINIVSSDKLKTYTQALIHRELTPLIIFGVVTIQKVNLMAMLGGLKLDGELSSFQVSLTHKIKSRGAAAQFKKWEESSLTGQLGQSTFSLFEEVPPNQQMVVKMTMGKSQTLISSQNRKGKDANSALLTIGPIMIDIPQHPVALHGMMTRSSRQLSTTLQELRSSRQPSRSSRQQNESDNITASMGGANLGPSFSSNLMTSPTRDSMARDVKENIPVNITIEPVNQSRPEPPKLIKPIIFQFSIVFDSFTIGASLLPSLRAQYKIGQITSNGIMGTKAKFVVDVREHTLSFNTNLPTSDSNLPTSANVSMPPIHVSAEYMEDPPPNRGKVSGPNRPESFADGIVLRKGSYLHAIADIGSFEHSLTTDLLNHLLLVQKVFMKEVNEVVQKMSGYESKILEPELGEMDKSMNDSLYSGFLASAGSSKGRYLLFSLHLRLKGIQITATTPTNSAVRLETGVMELQLSNRVQNMSSTFRGSHEVNLKLFIKLQVDLNVALGQLIRNALFEEADPEFQQLAYFKTRIVLRNALQDELVSSSMTSAEGKEALLITLHRPLLYIQPLALDKAVLVWLNYKNAYEYWNEQRANLNKEVLITTQQVLDKLPQIPQISPQNLGTLFLQLTIDDLGICLPISYSNTFQTSGLINSKPYDAELKSALVITLESTRISACSCGSLVSKARFTGLCFRFADDFETSLDDWKPDHSDPSVMNLCVVSEGTYEMCSKTITHMVPNHPALSSSDAKWLLNVSWKMEGFDIHVDTSIGKQFSALFKTLTAIAGDEDELDTIDYSSIDETANEAYDLKIDGDGGGIGGESETASPLINDPELASVNLRRTSVFKDTSMDTRKRSRLIEKELNEQAKIINDLKTLGASQSTIEQEIKRLHELESAVFNDFKRDVIKKLRRQSVKRSSFRDKMTLADTKMTPSITETCLNSEIEPGLTTSESDGTKSIEKPGLITGNYNNGDLAPRSISLELNTVDSIIEDPLFTSSSLDDKVYFASQSNSPKAQSLATTPTQDSSKSTSLSAISRSQSSSQQTSASISSDHLNTFSDSFNNTFSTATTATSTTTTSGSSKIDFTGSSVTTTTTSSNLSSPTNTNHINASCTNQNDSSDKSTDHLSPITSLHEKLQQSTGLKETSFAPEIRNIPFSANSNQSKPINYPIQEPYIDFELDIKVFFNSGKCVFHTRETTKDEDYSRKNGLPKERSFIGNPDGLSSPSGHIPRQSALRSSLTNNKPLNVGTGLKANLSSNRLRYPTTSGANTGQMDYSIFLIPGLDIKVHYNSKTVFGSTPGTSSSNHQPGINQSFGPSNLRVVPESRDTETTVTNTSSFPNTAKRGGSKKASCYAWMTLHSIPEETIISPHILDFMEQALEPIPIQPPSSGGKTSSPASDGHQLTPDDFARPDLITSAPAQYAVYGSFPVDVIVYLHMQPSVLRFSCLPVSRVECLLQLPSVDLVFSSKRLQDELDMSLPQQPLGKTFPYSSSCGPSRTGNVKHGHKRSASDYRHPQHQTETSIGGLSMTGCLADFSLYIFHPYGGQKKGPGSTLSSETAFSPHPKSNSDRKDALSLQVEFVKINISRSRRLVLSLETSPPSIIRSSHSSQDKLNQTVMIRFSALCDIGSASFKYDMRRLTETLAFPKAWYRKAIWKRMFLGDQQIPGHSIFSDQDYNLSSSSPSTSSSSTSIDESGLPTTSTIKTSVKGASGHFNKSPNSRGRESLWLNIQETDGHRSHHQRTSSNRMKHSHLHSSVSSEGTTQQQRQIMNAPWKTLILFGVNLCKLNVHMNMANVMGNTSWLTRGFRSEGRVSIDSNGHKSVNVSLGLDGSSLDAKGGIIGGIFEISQIQTKVNIKENYGKEPDHMITLKLDALEKRLDYMGTSILMLRMSDLDLNLRDEWRIDAGAGSSSNHPTKRPACIFIHCNLAWDQLQLLMSKSTTPDIMKIIAKLEEFFSQQFHNSKRVFSSSGVTSTSTSNRHSFKKDKGSRSGGGQSGSGQSGPGGIVKPSTPTSTSSGSGLIDSGSPGNEIYRHHRHWQKVLRFVSGASLSTLCDPLPTKGTILGGTFELIGNNISLACFYGINFRSKSWGLFSMLKPSISFASEAQDVANLETGSSDTHIIQNFTFSLGRRDRRRDVDEASFSVDCFYAQHSNMATVCKISRTVMFPPQFKSLHEWFQYTFAGSELDQINRFPVIEFERSGDGFGSAASAASGEFHSRRFSVNPKGNECHHSKEVIFALPSFQMDLKTEHLQGIRPPLAIDLKPRVDCTFVTDFDDHIFVAVDAEAYFFLHELITSYFKEKQIYFTRGPPGAQSLDKPDPLMEIKSTLTSTDSKGAPMSTETSTSSSSIQSVIYERDFREFNCQTWHLEPTVRLITWAGKNIEPYGVDYILQRLGFAQARTTIPKWIQRGAMDPLDKVLSAIMFRVISASKNESIPSSR